MTRVTTAVLLLLVATCATALPSAAELTEAERADIKRLTESGRDLRQGLRWVLSNVTAYTTPETRGPLGGVMQFYERAEVHLYVADAAFKHVGHVGAGSVGIDGSNVHKPNVTPEVWHEAAWKNVDLYLAHLANIQKQLDIADAHFIDTPDYQKNLRSAGALIVAAQTRVTAMNRTLKYLDPWPALRVPFFPEMPPFTIQTVVGPHGDYRLLHWDMNRMRNYTANAGAAILPEYQKGAADPVKFARVWNAVTVLRDTVALASALSAGVTFTAEEAGEDDFCRTLRVKKLISVSAPTAFHNWQGRAGALAPQPWANFISISADAWRHLDLANWDHDVFPESIRCASPFLKK